MPYSFGDVDQTQFKENPLFDGDEDDAADSGVAAKPTAQAKDSLQSLIKGAGWGYESNVKTPNEAIELSRAFVLQGAGFASDLRERMQSIFNSADAMGNPKGGMLDHIELVYVSTSCFILTILVT